MNVSTRCDFQTARGTTPAASSSRRHNRPSAASSARTSGVWPSRRWNTCVRCTIWSVFGHARSWSSGPRNGQTPCRATWIRPSWCEPRRAQRLQIHRHPAGIDGRPGDVDPSTVRVEISIARASNSDVARCTGRWCGAGQRPACSTPNDPSAASRATSRCRSSSRLCNDTLTSETAKANRPCRCHRLRSSPWIVTETSPRGSETRSRN